MQRTFVAITLALALTCAFASSFTSQNYVKNPQTVIADNETAFTNKSSLGLADVNTGEVDIVAFNSAQVGNTTNFTVDAIYRKIDGKALTATGNTTFNFTGTAPGKFFYFGGYAVFISVQDNNGTKQVAVSQKSISGGNSLATVYVSANTDVNSTPEIVTYATIGKNVYVFYKVANTSSQVNVTSFTTGTATKGTNFNLTTAFNGTSISVAWGEALGSNQLYANWKEGPANATVLRYATIDVTKGTVTANNTGAWNSNYSCVAYATDKKWYGDFCYVTTPVINSTDVAINYYVRFNETNLIPFNPIVNTTLYTVNSTYDQVFPYAAGIAVIYKETVSNANGTTYTYSNELWNLDTLKTTKNKTNFLTVSSDYTVQFYRVPSAGVYTLTDLQTKTVDNGTALSWFSEIKVGQVLGGSYLTSVLGFIMTIVASVLPF